MTGRKRRGGSGEILLAAAGMAALLVGIGFGRFAYTALVPALIQDGRLTAGTAGHVAAANFVGYLLGALAAARIARLCPLATILRAALAASAVAFLASAFDFGLAWLALWRFVPGFTGALLIVLVPVAAFRAVAPADRPRVAGTIFTGIGLGIALSGTLVPALASLGTALAWAVLGAGAAAAALGSWHVWGRIPDQAATPEGRHEDGPLPTLRLAALLAAYALDAVGFVPHTVYWVDYVARGLGQGFGVGGLQWILFGVGAMLGPASGALLARRIGFGPALALGFLVKAAAVALPLATTTPLALAVSSIAVGALTPGTAMLASGFVGDLVGPSRQRVAWGWLTTAFAAAQAAAASGFGILLASTGRYEYLYAVGATLLLGAAALAAAASRRR